jgi:hypothetical protein
MHIASLNFKLDPLGKMNHEFIQKNPKEEKKMTMCDGTVQFLDMAWQGEIAKELDEIRLFTKTNDNISHIKILLVPNTNGIYSIFSFSMVEYQNKLLGL